MLNVDGGVEMKSSEGCAVRLVGGKERVYCKLRGRSRHELYWAVRSPQFLGVDCRFSIVDCR